MDPTDHCGKTYFDQQNAHVEITLILVILKVFTNGGILTFCAANSVSRSNQVPGSHQLHLIPRLSAGIVEILFCGWYLENRIFRFFSLYSFTAKIPAFWVENWWKIDKIWFSRKCFWSGSRHCWGVLKCSASPNKASRLPDGYRGCPCHIRILPGKSTILGKSLNIT